MDGRGVNTLKNEAEADVYLAYASFRSQKFVSRYNERAYASGGGS